MDVFWNTFFHLKKFPHFSIIYGISLTFSQNSKTKIIYIKNKFVSSNEVRFNRKLLKCYFRPIFNADWQDGILGDTWVRAGLHQSSASMLRQLCDDARDTVLIENKEVAPDWGCNLFLSNSIIFNENNITSGIVELSHHWLTLGVNRPLVSTGKGGVLPPSNPNFLSPPWEVPVGGVSTALKPKLSKSSMRSSNPVGGGVLFWAFMYTRVLYIILSKKFSESSLLLYRR